MSLFLTLLFAALLAVGTGKASIPSLQLFVGGGIANSGPNFYVTLTREGELEIRRTSLPMVAPGKLTESKIIIRLKPEETKKILTLAEAAKDFDEACKPVPDGTSAHLALMAASGPIERKCSGAQRWPTGPKTRLFLERLNASIPEKFKIY